MNSLLLAAAALWGGIDVGMTQQQVETAYPAKAWINVTPDCRARVQATYREGRVTALRLDGKPTLSAYCVGRLRTDALAQFGQPLERSRTRSVAWRYGIYNQTLRWSRGEVVVTFRDMSPDWSMDFEAVEAPF
jgi:hypothetical protein